MRLRIPVTAECIGSLKGIISVECPNKGKQLQAQLYQGEASQGNASNYHRVPHLWLTWVVEGTERNGKSFSGKNIMYAHKEWDAMQTAIAVRKEE